jgi:hypothetical protein
MGTQTSKTSQDPLPLDTKVDQLRNSYATSQPLGCSGPVHPALQAPDSAASRAANVSGPAPQTANADGNGALCFPSSNRRRPRRK